MPVLAVLFGIFLYIYCEISLLVNVGSAIGVLPTLLLLIAISFLGLWFVKLRGIYTLYAIRQELSRGKMPTQAVLNSLMFVLAGVLLIIPGFLSDILAILCVLPGVRNIIQAFVLNSLKNRLFMRFTAVRPSATQNGNTFEAEFERKPDAAPPDKRLK